ncbi:UNVERIFIED_CONTAM: hypothetical protein GTU68_029909 [Idotea baltica]|nr:hypothetical protein [Idotea baltica]
MTEEVKINFSDLDLHPDVFAVIKTVGYEEPSPIQAQSIPIILDGSDMIGQAQTGTGKTAAFALPILSRMNASRKEPQTLVLAPTRELALQVATAFETYAKNLSGLRVVAIYGGAPMGPQLKAIRQGAQVIVATPGRLVDHLRRDSKMLSTIRHLVLDEADEMLKLGFMDDLDVIFNAIPKERQTVLFSATLPNSIRDIATKHLKNPKHIKIANKTQTVSTIEQSHILVRADEKNSAVARLLEVEEFDALIAFVRTKQATLDLASILEAKGYKVAALNGDIAQNQREKVITSLKNGRLDIVVATDVAARGLDVPRITHVLNVDMPYDPESYVHRIGRTGRAGRVGKALLLVTPRERRMLQVIERVTRQKVTESQLPNAQQILDARIKKLTNNLTKLIAKSEASYGDIIDQLATNLDCSVRSLAAALLGKATSNQAFTLAEVEKEQPKANSNRSKSSSNSRRSEGRTRCRAALGARNGVAPKNLLGAILNEGNLSRDAIGRIQIYESYSLIELPEEGLDTLFRTLKDTRVAGKLLGLRRYKD